MPPTAATKSCGPVGDRHRPCGTASTASSRSARAGVDTECPGPRPRTRRARAERGPAPPPAEGAGPAGPARPTLPGTPAMRSAEHARARVGHGARRPSSCISKMPTSPAGPKRCLTEVSTRRAWCRSPVEGQHGVDECSTARGPARSPSLVTWPTEEERDAGRLGQCGSAAPRRRAPGPGCRRAATARGRRRTGASRPPPGPAAGGSTAASTASTSGPSRARRWDGTAPSRAARPRTWVKDSSAEASRTSRPVAATDDEHLEEQRGLADARWPEQQRHRAGHHAAPEDPVELAHAGGQRVGRASDVTSRQRYRRAPCRRGRPADGAGCPGRDVTGAASSVFHSPQAGQRPTQRSDTASHACRGRDRRAAFGAQGGSVVMPAR